MKTVINRELLDHFKSIQFSVLLAAGILLYSVNGIVFAQHYIRVNSDYRLHISEAKQHPSSAVMSLYRSPSPWSFMAEGGAENSPAGYYLSPKQTLSAMPSGPRNFRLPEIPALDWAFIIKVVFSLYVILLGFEAISGEKERGTLRLVLSNPVSRIRLLTAKYVAILASAAIPMLVGLIASLTIIGVFVPSAISIQGLLRAVAFFLITLVFLSLFIFLSLLISSLILRSSLALLVLLSFWIIAVFIVPNTSDLLADSFSKVPDEYKMAKLVGPTLQKEVTDKMKQIQDRVQKGEIKTEKEVLDEAKRIFVEGQDSIRKLYADYDTAMKQRANLARDISRISPVALFQYSLEGLAGTGPGAHDRFLKDVQTYSTVFDAYVLKMVGEVIGTSPFFFTVYVSLNGKQIQIQSPFPQEFQGDKSDFPNFPESKLGLLDSLSSGLWNIAALLIWNIILAVFAFSAFVRADVR
jgi:ABC-type transport system involved in multi-copper enzyme maturation permease subunit